MPGVVPRAAIVEVSIFHARSREIIGVTALLPCPPGIATLPTMAHVSRGELPRVLAGADAAGGDPEAAYGASGLAEGRGRPFSSGGWRRGTNALALPAASGFPYAMVGTDADVVRGLIIREIRLRSFPP
jgi:hypothetical protein